MKQTMFRLDVAIHKLLRLTAIEKDVSMNTALTEAVKLWLKKHGKHVKG